VKNFNIRTRLTFQFSIIVSFILVLFSINIYYFSASYRAADFYSRLENKAQNTAKLLIEVKEINYETLKIIDRNTNLSLNEEKVVIYNYKGDQIYNSVDDDSRYVVPKQLLDDIRLERNINFTEGDYEFVGLLYTDRFDRFVVIASALDKYGRGKLNNLKWILIFGSLISIGLTIIAGRIFANRALEPMSNVVKQVDQITISSLNLRVNEGNGSDEIAQLAVTFNKMLERLESAFEMQRSFVSNASHELRTPLTSITGQIEVSLMKVRSNEEYNAILNSVLEDIKNLNELSNGLLDLAKASSDVSAISMLPIRLDEILWETRMEILERKKKYKINIKFSEPVEDENILTILGNEHLIKTAIANLMDNACKYSPNYTADVNLSSNDKSLILSFTDNGIGIDNEDLKSIFQPFFRAKNAKNIYGNGLGLSLTKKIIQIHKGEISIQSQINIGTSVTIRLPFFS